MASNAENVLPGSESDRLGRPPGVAGGQLPSNPHHAGDPHDGGFRVGQDRESDSREQLMHRRRAQAMLPLP